MLYTTQIWKKARLSLSGRPVIEGDEYEIMIQPNVGLYQGNHKVKNYQSGRVYLTNKRIIFVNANRKKDSICLDYQMIEEIECQQKFLKSNPKVIIRLKTITSNSNKSLQGGLELVMTTWVCPICSFSNDQSIPIDQHKRSKLFAEKEISCRNCGVTPEANIITDIVLDNTNDRSANILDLVSFDHSQCPNCTFVNHPSMKHCEICGSKLPVLNDDETNQNNGAELELDCDNLIEVDKKVIKLSLRSSGIDTFYTTICDAFIKFKDFKLVSPIQQCKLTQLQDLSSSAGIHGLTQTGNLQNKEASALLERSIQDIEQLMSKANDLISVSQKYKNIVATDKLLKKEADDKLQLIAESKQFVKKLNRLELKLELGESIQQSRLQRALDKLKIANATSLTISRCPEFYIEELARHIADFLTTNNVLENNNGIITLTEVFLLYNRCRQIDLITPEELLDAARKFESLNVGFKIKNLSLTTSTKFHISKKFPSIYVVSKHGSEESILQKIIQYVLLNPGTSEIQIQRQFNTNIVIIRYFLNSIAYSGELTLDKTLEGTFYWQNNF